MTSPSCVTVTGPVQLSLTPLTEAIFGAGTSDAQLTVTGDGQVNVGGSLSITVTGNEQVEVFPFKSVTVYDVGVVPTGNVPPVTNPVFNTIEADLM